MSSRSNRMEELLSKPGGVYRGLDATGSRVSRRELLETREAIAQGMVIELVGVTREPNFPEETPHRHTFSARFQPTRISTSTIVGDVTGRTQAVISTGTAKEDQHFHDIQGTGVVLDALILSGTENNVPGEHKHQVSIE